MTSTLNSASTVRMLHRFATRRPEWFAVLVFLAYILPPIVLGPRAAGRSDPAPRAARRDRLVRPVPAVLLTALGWWGTAGSPDVPPGSLIPFLPLVLLFAVPPVLPLGSTAASHTPATSPWSQSARSPRVRHGSDITRGSAADAAAPRAHACRVSSVLFGAIFIAPLAAGEDPVLVGAQALATMGIGVAFAAVVVVTGTIWPLVVISAAMSIPLGIQNDYPAALTGILVSSLTVGALAAAYGIWLLHRDQHRRADHSGKEDEQFSPPREPSAA